MDIPHTINLSQNVLSMYSRAHIVEEKTCYILGIFHIFVNTFAFFHPVERPYMYQSLNLMCRAYGLMS